MLLMLLIILLIVIVHGRGVFVKWYIRVICVDGYNGFIKLFVFSYIRGEREH